MKCGSVVGLLALVLLASGCASANPPAAPEVATAQPSLPPAVLAEPGEPGTLQPTRCRFALPEGLREGIEVDCAYLTVPEQRNPAPDSPASRMIQLAVAIFHPPGGALHKDPVIFLSGGPGASALEPMQYQFEVMSEPVFAAGRDLVVFDQRGVGVSRPALDCPAYDDLALELIDRQVDGRPIQDDEVTGLVMDALGDCHESLVAVADLTAYNSAASAADVEDLRRALGTEQVNLWGGSYGTRLALEVMRRYPGPLRSVVLDAVYPPDVDLYLQAPANFERALERLFEACAANAVCRMAHPDLRHTFFETVERLNVAPALVESEDPVTGEVRKTWISGDTLLALTFQLLYDSRLRYLLPEQIDAASRGDYRAFEQVIAALAYRTSLSSRGLSLSVQCNEELSFSSIEAFRAQLGRHPDIAGIYHDSLLGEMAYRVCEKWGAGRAEASANEAVMSDIPTLIMTGEFDPITPPEWGRHAAETLSRAYAFEYPGVGHGASGFPGCPQQMFIAFLTDPLSAPEDDCVADMQ